MNYKEGNRLAISSGDEIKLCEAELGVEFDLVCSYLLRFTQPSLLFVEGLVTFSVVYEGARNLLVVCGWAQNLQDSGRCAECRRPREKTGRAANQQEPSAVRNLLVVVEQTRHVYDSQGLVLAVKTLPTQNRLLIRPESALLARENHSSQFYLETRQKFLGSLTSTFLRSADVFIGSRLSWPLTARALSQWHSPRVPSQ